MKIILLRHAKVEYKNSPIYANQMGEWIERYNRELASIPKLHKIYQMQIFILQAR